MKTKLNEIMVLMLAVAIIGALGYFLVGVALYKLATKFIDSI